MNNARYRRKKALFSSALALLVILAINMNLSMANNTDITLLTFLTSFVGQGILDIILFLGIDLLVYYCICDATRIILLQRFRKASVIIPAFLFSNFQIWGYSFEMTDSWELVLSNTLQLAKSLFSIAVYFLFFGVLIQKLYAVLDGICITEDYVENKSIKNRSIFVRLFVRYKQLLLTHPKRITCITLLIAFIPYIIATYPGFLTPDSVAEIFEGFGEITWTNSHLSLLNPKVLITRWHSVTYTLFIHCCLMIGKSVFNSDNVGIFIVSITHVALAITILATCVSYLIKKRVKVNLVCIIILFFCFNYPIISSFSLIVKDVSYAFLFLFFSFAMLRYINSTTNRNIVLVIVAVSGFILGTLRNEFIYEVAITFLIMSIVFRKDKIALKKGIICGAPIISLIFSYNCVLTQMGGTAPSKGEMLSVPFQQTARYLRDCPDDVNQYELQSINSVLDGDRLAELYVPRRADNVKFTYKKTVSKTDLIQYFQAWLHMFIKHPGVYLQATANQIYDFFYISPRLSGEYYNDYDYSTESMEKCNSRMINHSLNIRYPQTKRIRNFRAAYTEFSEAVFKLPIVSLLNKAGFIIWMLLLWFFYLCRRNNKIWISIGVLFLSVLLMGLLGPCGGYYFRYIWPIVVSLPIMIPLSFVSGSPDFDY